MEGFLGLTVCASRRCFSAQCLQSYLPTPHEKIKRLCHHTPCAWMGQDPRPTRSHHINIDGAIDKTEETRQVTKCHDFYVKSYCGASQKLNGTNVTPIASIGAHSHCYTPHEALESVISSGRRDFAVGPNQTRATLYTCRHRPLPATNACPYHTHHTRTPPHITTFIYRFHWRFIAIYRQISLISTAAASGHDLI